MLSSSFIEKKPLVGKYRRNQIRASSVVFEEFMNSLEDVGDQKINNCKLCRHSSQPMFLVTENGNHNAIPTNKPLRGSLEQKSLTVTALFGSSVE
jgi:hypothetical protein